MNPEIIKFLEAKRGGILFGMNQSNIFLSSPKAKETNETWLNVKAFA